MTAMQIDNKIYASDAITGWSFYQSQNTILHTAIENGDIKSCISYMQKSKYYDTSNCLGVTPLFMMLQYSVVADYSEPIKIHVNKKIENKTDFTPFLENMNQSKMYGDNYYNRLITLLKNIVGDNNYNYIMNVKISLV
jgi:hypothetical protein